MFELLQRGWHHELAQLVESSKVRLLVAAPFISNEGASFLVKHLPPSLRQGGRVEVITDLSPSHVCDGSLEPRAVASICQTAHSFILWHIPRFHAKVYVADGKRVIISSANLTAGGFYRNVEYGIKIQDDSIARAVEDHFQDFRATGTTIAIAQLLNYVEASDRVRESFVKQQRTVDPRLKKAFNAALGAAEEVALPS